MDVRPTPAAEALELPLPPPSRAADAEEQGTAGAPVEPEVDLEGNDGTAFFEAASRIRAEASTLQAWDVAAGFKAMGQGRVDKARVSLTQAKDALARLHFGSWQAFTSSLDKEQLAQLPVGMGQAMLAFVLFAAWAVVFYSAKFGPRAITTMNERVVQPALTAARPYLDQGRERALQGLEASKSKMAQLLDKATSATAAAAAEGNDV